MCMHVGEVGFLFVDHLIGFVHDSKRSQGYHPAAVYMSFGPFLFFSLKDWQRKQLIAAKTPSKELEELLPALARHLDLPTSCVLFVSVGLRGPSAGELW